MHRFLILTLILVASPAQALRCGGKLIDEGLAIEEVVELCGEPAESRDLGIRVIPYVGRRGAHGVEGDTLGGRFSQEVRVTELIYDFGPRKLRRRMTFYDDILVDVATLDYGHRR